jgi:hypothetical protein
MAAVFIGRIDRRNQKQNIAFSSEGVKSGFPMTEPAAR